MTCNSSSCRTVTGTCRPSAWNKRVIPTFFAITPVRMIKTPRTEAHRKIPVCVKPNQMFACPAWASAPAREAAGTQPGADLRRYHPICPRGGRRLLRQLKLHVDACSKIELHQRVVRLRRGLHDVEQPLVRSHLELLARLLVDVRRTIDGEFLDPRRKRDGPANESTRAARRVGDVASSLIEHSMIERLQANPDVLRFHIPTDAKEPASHCFRGSSRNSTTSKANRATLIQNRAVGALYYFVMFATTPAPTVRPPSRIAKRRPWSMAIGAISLTPRFTLSPGITISVPSGSTTSPVTSVVRK